MIDATNREDRSALLAAVAADASLVDFGRSFAGKKGIAHWSDNENIGNHNRITVTAVTRSGSTTTVYVTLTGDGYNGRGALHFDPRNGQNRPTRDNQLSPEE